MSPTAEFSPRCEATRLTVLLGLLLVVAVMWCGRKIPGFDYAILMDDDTNIVFNPHLGVLDAARLKWMFTDIDYVARYLPLGWLSFSVLVSATGLSPLGCHLAGVGFHALNAVLVLGCLRRLLRHFASGASPTDHALAAGVGALLWALHPLRVESTAWCSGLLYVEGGFFALVAVYARLRELEARAAPGGRGGKWFGLGAAAFAISLLIYPVALFLPAVMALLDFAWFKSASSPGAGVTRVLRWELALLAGFSALELWVTIVARQVHIQNGVPPPTLAEFSLAARAFQAVYVWASYVWRTFWPVHLTPVMEALFEIRPGDVRIWGAFPTLLAISALAWRWRRRAMFFGACWLAYLAWMIPVLGLSEHPHTAADRYSYLISVLFSVVLALGLMRVRDAGWRRGLLMLGALAAVACAGLSAWQARIWHDPVTMHRYVLTRLQDEDLRRITLIRLAKLQFLDGEVRDGRELAMKIYAEAPNVAGVARSWRELAPKRPLPSAVLARPLQEWPAKPWACLHETIAREQFAAGRFRDARAHLDAAVAQAPDYLEVRFRRALVLAALGEPHAALHDWLLVEHEDGRALTANGPRFAADQIAAALRAAGEEKLAEALQRRAQR